MSKTSEFTAEKTQADILTEALSRIPGLGGTAITGEEVESSTTDSRSSSPRR